MSKENCIMSQHIIQKALLKRFANRKGKIFVHRFDNNTFLGSYPTDPKKVACADNYFDEDPYSITSLETRFLLREKSGQKSLDRILEGEFDKQLLESIVDYAGMMIGRDPSFLESIKRTHIILTGKPIDDEIERELKHLQYEMSEEGILLHPYSELTAFTRSLVGKGRYLLTGDHPYIVMDFNHPGSIDGLIRELGGISPGDIHDVLIQEARRIMRNIVVAVPITPTTCVFVRNRERPDIEEILSEETFNSILYLINLKIVIQARSEVYGDRNYGCVIETIRSSFPVLLKIDPLLEIKLAVVGHDMLVF